MLLLTLRHRRLMMPLLRLLTLLALLLTQLVPQPMRLLVPPVRLPMQLAMPSLLAAKP